MWKVKKKRPEEKTTAKEYFDKYADAYSTSNAIKTIQKRITLRALELIGWKSGRILDVGCGPGFSMEVLLDNGFNTIGIDLSEKMVKEAKKNGFDALVADMRKLPFEDNSFDGILSISALQWIPRKDLKKVAKEFYRVLTSNGSVVIQFYPKSEKDMIAVGKAFVSAGFDGEFAIDNPKNPRKRKIYLVLKKKTEDHTESQQKL